MSQLRKRIIELKVKDGSVLIDDLVVLPTEKVREGSRHLFIVLYNKTGAIKTVCGTDMKNDEPDWKRWALQVRCNYGAVES